MSINLEKGIKISWQSPAVRVSGFAPSYGRNPSEPEARMRKTVPAGTVNLLKDIFR